MADLHPAQRDQLPNGSRAKWRERSARMRAPALEGDARQRVAPE
jgi:hypothetical protein